MKANFNLKDGDDALMHKLTLRHSAILKSSAVHSGKYNLIAEELQIPLGTVRSRLHRARAALSILRGDQTPALAAHV